jgi:Cof subfamily protein (haloacid dehalogenase superfamily)
MNKHQGRYNSTIRTVPSPTSTDVRLLVLDIDGTIGDRSNRIRDSVARAIHSVQSRGIAIAIATGRSYRCSLHAYDFIGSNLPLICYEGALIREPNTGFVHRHWPVQTRVAAQLLEHIELLNLSDRLSVLFHIQDNLYVSNLNNASMKYFEDSGVEPIVVSDMRQLLNRPTTKVVVLSDDVHDIRRLSIQLKNSHSRIRVRHDKWITVLEAFNPAVDKRLAVSYLAEDIMALRPENVMAVGNDFNDIGMLRYAGIGVAMEQAPIAVRAFADWVTTTIEKDGVARAIERWILR